jgi:hypothetical protein
MRIVTPSVGPRQPERRLPDSLLVRAYIVIIEELGLSEEASSERDLALSILLDLTPTMSMLTPRMAEQELVRLVVEHFVSQINFRN